VAQGDQHYAQRAEGSSGPIARTFRTEQALDAYRAAVRADPAALPARWRLIRTLYFRGTFCGASKEQVRAFREEAKIHADEGVRLLERSLGSPRGEQRVRALQAREEAVALYFWSAVAWGEWAMMRGPLTSVRTGAASRIRDLAQTVIDVDPRYENGGGYRILGRLHDRAPRIPLITGWVSREKGIALLERSLAADPCNSISQIFLAEALQDHAPQRREEARRLLQACASASPRPEYAVEDAHFSAMARERLQALRAAN
jgi:tetratricopeptide (TPR) repeat protein